MDWGRGGRGAGRSHSPVDPMAVYLDYNATTPVDPRVADAMEPFFRSHHGNPGSAHAFGSAAREGLQNARAQVARLIRASPEQISFMSCATETINYVIRGVSAQCRLRGEHAHIVTSAAEHVAVLEACKYVEAYEGATVSVVGVHGDGRVDVEALVAALTERTALVSVMHANNEVGALNDVRAIVDRVRSACASALVHCDASQSVAKVPVDVRHLGVDFLTVAGHKLYAPKGVAALYARDPTLRLPNVRGRRDASRRRTAGAPTPPAPALPAAVRRRSGRRATRGDRECGFCSGAGQGVRDRRPRTTRGGGRPSVPSGQPPHRFVRANAVPLYPRAGLRPTPASPLSPAALERRVQGLHVVHGPHDPAHRLPTTLSISFPGVWASDVVSLLGTEVACSAGAACHAEGPPRVSHVLAAMGVDEEVAMGTLRLSVGRFTMPEEVGAPPPPSPSRAPLRLPQRLLNDALAGRAGRRAPGGGGERATLRRSCGHFADAPSVSGGTHAPAGRRCRHRVPAPPGCDPSRPCSVGRTRRCIMRTSRSCGRARARRRGRSRW